MKKLKELYLYREMIISLVKKDLRGRYKQSVLGFLWTFINPLLQLLVYNFVFSVILKNNIERYYLYLFVGLVPWIFFSTSITGGSTSIVFTKDLVKKIYFPREVLPIAYVTSCFVNMLFSFIVIFLVILISGVGFNFMALMCLPIVMLVEYILAIGIAMLVSALTVYFRDLQHILGIVIMAWLYFTPIMYSIKMVPENVAHLFYINPMTPIIAAYRNILYDKEIPTISTLLHAFILGILFLVVGSFVFAKLQKNFVEEL